MVELGSASLSGRVELSKCNSPQTINKFTAKQIHHPHLYKNPREGDGGGEE